MKQSGKTIATLVIGLTLSFGLSFSSCKKAETGPKGATGEAGPEAKSYNVYLTYNAGDIAKSFTGITDYDIDDAVLCYLMVNSSSSKLTLPVTYDGVQYKLVDYPYSESIGAIQVLTYNPADGVSSPWNGTNTLHFKVVHIKSSGLITHPDVNLSNYEEVKAAYDL